MAWVNRRQCLATHILLARGRNSPTSRCVFDVRMNFTPSMLEPATHANEPVDDSHAGVHAQTSNAATSTPINVPIVAAPGVTCHHARAPGGEGSPHSSKRYGHMDCNPLRFPPVFVCLSVGFIASQYTLNKPRLQQYPTPTVYVPN